MKNQIVHLSEGALRNMILEALDEWQLSKGQNPVRDDGKYVYQGTGSDDSKERMKKIRAKTEMPGGDFRASDYERHGEDDDTQFEKYEKEYGKMRSPVMLKGATGKGNAYGIISAIHNFADGEADDVDEYNIDRLKKESDAKEFLKFLYMNGLGKSEY